MNGVTRTHVEVHQLRGGRYLGVAKLYHMKMGEQPRLLREAGVIRNTEAAARAVARLDLFLASLPRVYVPND